MRDLRRLGLYLMTSSRVSLPCLVWIILFLAGAWSAQAQTIAAAVNVNPAIVQQAVQDGEKIWRAVRAEPSKDLASRDLFTYALALCDGRTHPERLERIFTVAAQMQQRDPAHRAYGNFRWSWGNAEVVDFNAVDFCMQAGAILWIRHRDTMRAEARALLATLLEHGVEGLRRHRVNESYTNIALMNAGNLLLLGEALGRADIAAEGAARLDRVVLYTAEAGVHEYTSPTYYGVDLDDVMLIEVFSRNERARAQARALRDLLWSDVALNWFGPAGKLAGAHSRDYDYLRGLGYLDQQLQANGWIKPANGRASNVIFLAYLPATVAPEIRALSEKFPRLVTQTWGLERSQTRTHYLAADVTFSSAGAGYGGRMDLPLTVDLPGPRESVRGYFIPDGRSDPYGKIKIAESAAHSKTLHLQPFWTAAQRRVDALGLAIYRPKDLPAGTRTLESHFVLPADVDELWVDGEAVHFKKGEAAARVLKPGAAVVLRKGTALVGVRVPWARTVAGVGAAVALVNDAENYGALRLTVTHHLGADEVKAEAFPGVAFWVRVGSGVATPAAVAKWRAEFAAAKAEVADSSGRVEVRVAGQDGSVAVSARAPFQAEGMVEPRAPRQILACDSEDIGGKILAGVEPVRAMRSKRAVNGPVAVPAAGSVTWEAESGVITPPMTADEDAAASKGLFVWMPAKAGERAGSSVGRTRYELTVAKAGVRYLWGRVLTPTPENDSFMVAAATEQDVVLEPTAWPVGVHKAWTWVRFTPDAKGPGVALPSGDVTLEIRVREAGAKLDQLFLTTDPKAPPPP